MRRLLPILAALLGLAAPASAATPLELAVQDDAVLLHGRWGDPALALDRAAEMGAERLRVNLGWAWSMPTRQARGRYHPEEVAWDFSALERLYEQAAARDIKLQVTLTGPAPAWATSNGKVGYTRPDPVLFADFVIAVAAHFAGRVDRYSIWNEPNWNRLLAPKKSAPSMYRQLYRAGYQAIKNIDPKAAVLIGEMMPGANRTRSTPLLQFLRKVTCSRKDYKAARRCGGLKADGFAIHPYNFARRPKDAKNPNLDIVEMGSLSRLTRALDKLRRRGALRTPGNRPMPLYLTEFGYHTTGPLARKSSVHASWMREAWYIAERNPRVKQLLQYMLIDPWDRRVTWRSAVLNRDGSRRRVFYTLRDLATGA
jgi:hypothetical protein